MSIAKYLAEQKVGIAEEINKTRERGVLLRAQRASLVEQMVELDKKLADLRSRYGCKDGK